MKLQEIYDVAVQMGIKSDPRGADGIKQLLKRVKKDYEEMPQKEKEFFDKELFKNPYSDSRILYGETQTEVKKILAGIDADATEVLLADRLTERGNKIDLVISHHPAGHALASLHEVMDVQIEMYAQAGVPVNVAHSLFQQRKSDVSTAIAPLNHSQAVETARLLDIPLLALHTIWDNLGNEFMNSTIESKKYDTVGEVMDEILEIPEFREAKKGKNPPRIASGDRKSRAGKVVVNFTGGTNPSKDLYVELAKAGVGTLVEMHVPHEAVKELKKHHINIVDCGHMAADSIGANLFFDEIEKKGVEVIPCSGLIRVRRSK